MLGASPTPPDSPPPILWLKALGLAVLVLVAYGPAFTGGFVWDDATILEVPHFREPGGLFRLWTDPWSIPGEEHYWPLVYSTFWAVYALAGPWAPAFHGLNVVLHAVNTLLVVVVARRLRLQGAWAAGVLFALHPVHVESVAWVIELKDLLSALFFLGAVWAFVPLIEVFRWRTAALVGALALAGMLSKSVVVTLPVILLFLVWGKGAALRPSTKGFLIMMALSFGGLLYFDHQVLAAAGNTFTHPPFLERIQIMGDSFWFYAAKLVWPWPLSPLYPPFPADGADPLKWLPFLTAAGLVLGAGGWAWRFSHQRPAFWFLCAYGVLLSPTLGLVPFSFMQFSYVADRYQYLASVVPILGLCHLVAQWARAGHGRQRVALWGLLGFSLIFLPLTWDHTRTYTSNEAFARRILTLQPEHPLGWQLLTVALGSRGDKKGAREAARKLVEIQPKDPLNWNNLAVLEAQTGNTTAAISHARRALTLEPGHEGSQALLKALGVVP